MADPGAHEAAVSGGEVLDPARLPTFITIGAMKSGTSSLRRYLGAHPDVFTSRRKEPNFFNRHEPRGRPLEDYQELFAGGEEAAARGESSVNYTKRHMWPRAAERIARTLPDVRLVVVLRDPIDRIRSHYRHSVAAGRATRPIDEDLERTDNYVLTSCYAWQLEAYLEHVDRARLHLVTAERLRAEPDTVVAEICEHVGVDPSAAPPVAGEHHRSEDKEMPQLRERGPLGVRRDVDISGEMSERRVAWLRRRLMPEVRAIGRLLGDETDLWSLR